MNWGEDLFLKLETKMAASWFMVVKTCGCLGKNAQETCFCARSDLIRGNVYESAWEDFCGQKTQRGATEMYCTEEVWSERSLEKLY